MATITGRTAVLPGRAAMSRILAVAAIAPLLLTVVAVGPAHAAKKYHGTVLKAAHSLRVAGEVRHGYDRDKFHLWIDADQDGCDTRDEVLVQEATEAPDVGSSCSLTSGRWFSYYDRVRTSDSSTFDIDHVVPLAEAWDSGARAWTAGTRERYANDLGDRRTLVAVTAHANRSKSDQDPAEWLPTYARCRYVRQWVAVKIRWRLTVDRAEKRVLVHRADGCRERTLTVRRARITKHH